MATREDFINTWLDLTGLFCASISSYASSTSLLIDKYLISLEQPTKPANPIQPVPIPPVKSYFDTTYEPVDGSQTIYVSSSSGLDSNHGMSEDAPLKTVSFGLDILRNGYPDRLLFKRGDIWSDEVFGDLTKSGRSLSEPMIFGSYGDITKELPRFNTGDKEAVNTFPKGNPVREPKSVDYLAFVGLHFCANARVPGTATEPLMSSPVGFRWLQGTRGLIIDDCTFEYYHTNLVIQSYNGTEINNVSLSNSRILNAYSNSEDNYSQGIYVDGVGSLEITNCIFDNNGHNDYAENSTATIHNHNIYIQKNCKNIIVQNNIISRASSHGCQIRPGGYVLSNFFYQNPIAILVGYDDPSIVAQVSANVITEGTMITTELLRSWGIEFKGQNPSGVVLKSNICVNRLDDSPNSRSIEYRSNITYENNITYNWPPTGAFDNPDAFYRNPTVNIGMTSDEFYNKMRIHTMDNYILYSNRLINRYVNGFTEA